MHGPPSKNLQGIDLLPGQEWRPPVHHADGPNRLVAGGDERHPRKKPDPDFRHKELVGKRCISQRIGHDEDVGSQNYVGRKRTLSRNLIELEADFRFEPHPLLIDKSDLADGSIADDGSQTKNVVKCLLAGGSQNPKAMKTFETGAFVAAAKSFRCIPVSGREVSRRGIMTQLYAHVKAGGQ